jgi:hypothetical protein
MQCAESSLQSGNGVFLKIQNNARFVFSYQIEELMQQIPPSRPPAPNTGGA